MVLGYRRMADAAPAGRHRGRPAGGRSVPPDGWRRQGPAPDRRPAVARADRRAGATPGRRSGAERQRRSRPLRRHRSAGGGRHGARLRRTAGWHPRRSRLGGAGGAGGALGRLLCLRRPFLPTDLVDRLAAGRQVSGSGSRLRRLDGAGTPGVRPVAGGDSAPTCAAPWPKRASARSTRFTTRYRLATVEIPPIETAAGPVDPFFNANRPDDLAEAERLLGVIDG